jgi:hypothetical protein
MTTPAKRNGAQFRGDGEVGKRRRRERRERGREGRHGGGVLLAAPSEVREEYAAAEDEKWLGTLTRLEEEREHAASMDGGV